MGPGSYTFTSIDQRIVGVFGRAGVRYTLQKDNENVDFVYLLNI